MSFNLLLDTRMFINVSKLVSSIMRVARSRRVIHKINYFIDHKVSVVFKISTLAYNMFCVYINWKKKKNK